MIKTRTTHNLGRAYGHPHGHREQGRFSLYSDPAEGGRATQARSAEAERRPRDCAASFYPPIVAATCGSSTRRCLSGAQSLAPPARPNPSSQGASRSGCVPLPASRGHPGQRWSSPPAPTTPTHFVQSKTQSLHVSRSTSLSITFHKEVRLRRRYKMNAVFLFRGDLFH